jgi:hypothetical protein
MKLNRAERSLSAGIGGRANAAAHTSAHFARIGRKGGRPKGKVLQTYEEIVATPEGRRMAREFEREFHQGDPRGQRSREIQQEEGGRGDH